MIIAVILALAASAAGPALAAEPLTNRLAAETSEYLRSAGASPVAWQPWGAPAFRLARELDRPILLSVGAGWCHWCHVMDRETYADPAIAAFINAHFVPIKVDRDDRPDVDARYQESARSMLGVAGWPLTLFLTADGGLVTGGDTFLPDARDGIPGLRPLLARVVALLREHREDARAAALAARRLPAAPDLSVRSAQLSPRLAGEIVEITVAQFDTVHGGFGEQAKHVPAAVLTLIGRRYAESDEPRLREVLTKTLDAMATGAIRDHLGGGFFRYTTDRAWREPHFERLDFIQAQAIGAYLLGYQTTGAPRYRAVAEAVLAYTDRVLVRRGGGFHAAQSGDGPGGDHRYFVWNEADVRAALAARDADLLVRHFGLAGVVERRPLAIGVGVDRLAADAGVSIASMERRVRAGAERLRRARAGRGEPVVEPTVYADRSALLASGYLEAYKVLGGDHRRRVALETLDFLWARLRQPDGGMAHAYRDGRGTTAAGFLDDQMAVAAAFLDAFEVTGAVVHLDSARALVAYAVASFRDADGAFRDTPIGGVEPGVPTEPRKSFVDEDRPSGNALAALVLERLYGLTNDASYRTLARDTLAAFPLSAHRLGPLAASYAYAVDLHLNGAVHVVIAGKATDPRTGALSRGALRAFRPGKTVAAYDPGTIDPDRLPAPVAAMLRQPAASSEPRAYVCSGTLCSLPQQDPDAVRGLVERLGRRP